MNNWSTGHMVLKIDARIFKIDARIFDIDARIFKIDARIRIKFWRLVHLAAELRTPRPPLYRKDGTIPRLTA
jgi:hypothetical protein